MEGGKYACVARRPGFRSWLPMLRFWFRKWGTTHHLPFKSITFKKNCSPLPVRRTNNGHNYDAHFHIFSVATRQISFFLHWFLPTCTANKYTRTPHYLFTTDLQLHRTLLSDCFLPLNANIQALDSRYIQILTVRFPVPDIITPSSSRSPASQGCTSSSPPPAPQSDDYSTFQWLLSWALGHCPLCVFFYSFSYFFLCRVLKVGTACFPFHLSWRRGGLG